MSEIIKADKVVIATEDQVIISMQEYTKKDLTDRMNEVVNMWIKDEVHIYKIHDNHPTGIKGWLIKNATRSGVKETGEKIEESMKDNIAKELVKNSMPYNWYELYKTGK